MTDNAPNNMFDFDFENMKINKQPRLTDADFEVTPSNYVKGQEYTCENSHYNAEEPQLVVHSSSFDPKTSEYSMNGVVVFACKRCGMPVFIDD